MCTEDRTSLLGSCRLAFVARGGTWTPTSHHHWPDGFKHAARALLLVCSRSSGAGSSARCLPVLPDFVLLHIIQLAATPMSAWMCQSLTPILVYDIRTV
jgi:hypothetical protein